MLKAFRENIINRGLIAQGDKIVLGVSGGPDSLAMLNLMFSLKEEMDLTLYVAHVDHQYRGAESEADKLFVESFSKRLGVECISRSVDVEMLARNKGISFEEAGRLVRYKLFYDILHEKRADKIAVAQNLDDQGETVLMRLFRGSGLDGLSGIKHMRDGVIIRPLLNFTRSEIEAYCEENHLEQRIDRTNLQPIYTRNKIRLELVPYLEANFNPNIKRTLYRTADNLSDDLDFIQSEVQSVWERIVVLENQRYKCRLAEISNIHSAIRKRIYRKLVTALNGDLKDVSSAQIDRIEKLCTNKKTGTFVQIANDINFMINYDILEVFKGKITDKLGYIEEYQYQFEIGSEIKFSEPEEMTFKSYVIHLDEKAGETHSLSEDKLRVKFDLDKLSDSLFIRNRRNGDRFIPFGMKGSKKLKDFFIDNKIPREIRNNVPLVLDGDKIIWVVGYRKTNDYQVTNETRNVLILECIRA